VAQDFDVETSRGRLRVHQFDPVDPVPVFCVPGLSSNSRVFDALGDYRARHGRGTIAFDLRGRGWSDVTAAGTYGWDNHAFDLFEAADALGVGRFDLVGHSMGAFVSMAAVAMDMDKRVRRVVLIDGLGLPTQTALRAIIAGVQRLSGAFATRDAYVESVRATGLASPWTPYWDRHYRYDLIEVNGGVRPRTDAAAVGEDAAYGATHDLHELWPHQLRPTLLLRATVPIGGSDGFIVTKEDYESFLRAHPNARGEEIASNHFGIVVEPASQRAIDSFLAAP